VFKGIIVQWNVSFSIFFGSWVDNLLSLYKVFLYLKERFEHG